MFYILFTRNSTLLLIEFYLIEIYIHICNVIITSIRQLLTV